MTNIAIIIPVYEGNINTISKYLPDTLKSVENNTNFYKEGKLDVFIIYDTDKTKAAVKDAIPNLPKNGLIKNTTGEYDFCSQINFGAKYAQEHGYEWFSILEYDDLYNDRWFSMWHPYYNAHEDVSVFLPLNVQTIEGQNIAQYCNEAAWAKDFSEELGFIDYDALQEYSAFNLTGGIFNVKDFLDLGGLKHNIKVAFNYEFMLRATNKGFKIFVVPKEGYDHLMNREEGLSCLYAQEMDADDVETWFRIAKREYAYVQEREIDFSRATESETDVLE